MTEPHPYLVLIGKKIRDARKAKGFSQEGFALESGIARSYYSGVERGQRNLAAVNIVRVADTLGCEPGELFPTIQELRAALAALDGKQPRRATSIKKARRAERR